MAIDELDGQHLRKQKMRDIKRIREGRPFWKRLLIQSGCVFFWLALVGLGITFSLFVVRSETFTLTEVRVLGSRHVDAEELQRGLLQEFSGNLYRIRLQKVREFVEAKPWVQSCQVRRVFPNTLKVLIVERQPVALAKIEDELFPVDRFGVVLEAHGARFQYLDLPVVRGLENSTQENVSAANRVKMETVMRALAELDSGPEKLSDRISEIDVTDPSCVALVPADRPIKVFLGDSNYRERYRIYLSKLALMADLAQKYGAVDSVDLSVDHRIIFHTKNGKESGINLKSDRSG